jgi:hypothetical protein
VTLYCLMCCSPLWEKRSDAVYCSSACRQRSYRYRQGRGWWDVSPAQREQRRRAGAASANARLEAKVWHEIEHAKAVFARLGRL